MWEKHSFLCLVKIRQHENPRADSALGCLDFNTFLLLYCDVRSDSLLTWFYIENINSSELKGTKQTFLVSYKDDGIFLFHFQVTFKDVAR